MWIRRFTLAFGMAIWALPAASEDCSAEKDMLIDGFERNRWDVVDEGFFNDAFGTCKISRMQVLADGLKFDVGSLEWKLNGLDALASETGSIGLSLKLRDLRMVPTNSDPWISYMLDQQNRYNLIDADLNASLDLDSGEFEVQRLDIDLPGQNEIKFRVRSKGLTPSVLRGNTMGLAALSVESLEIFVKNMGFADGLILGALMGAMSNLPGTPESQMEATRSEARSIVNAVPSEVLAQESKDALGRLIDEAPVPWGAMGLRMDAEPPLPLVRFPALLLSSDPFDPAALGFAFSGASIEVTFTPSTSVE